MTNTEHGAAPLSEVDIVSSLIRGVLAQNEDICLAVEVRSHGRARTDVVLLDGGELIGVEAKRSDWRQAVAQAVLNRYCVDRSYIALWSSSVNDQVVNESRRMRIGVLAVDHGGVVVVRKAPKSRPIRELRRRVLAAAFPEVDE